MAQMNEIKKRIKGIKQTRQISRVMMLISAAKLKRARIQLEGTRPYFDKVTGTIADILRHSANLESPFFRRKKGLKAGVTGYVIITGDKGLAGGYNGNVAKLAERKLQEDREALLFVAGNKGRNYFLRKNYRLWDKFNYPVEEPTLTKAGDMARILLDLFERGELSEVFLIFTRMVTSIKLEPYIMRLLPLDPDSLNTDNLNTDNLNTDRFNTDKNRQSLDEGIVYEPSPEAVLDSIVPIYLEGVIYGALVEAFTSEQSARMMAMDNATSNADQMLQRLSLYYNRARQAAITREISEIVGGTATQA